MMDYEKRKLLVPTISVIVPVYKVEKYICRCVDSILGQTFTDFELILVDDGSPDNCPAICDEYATKDNRIRVIHKKNGGLSSARNVGLDIAAGKYILFCDSDDYVASDWCQTFIDCVLPSEDNYIFGGINTVRISDDGQTVSAPPMMDRNFFPVPEYLKLQSKGILGFACNVLYYASILNQYRLRFSETVIVEDLPFNLAYLRYINCLTYTNSAGYYYIQDCRETLSRKYYPEIFQKWKEKYQVTQRFIEEVLPIHFREENRYITANIYLFRFLQALNNTFDKRNPKRLFGKLKYNISVVRSLEFQHCLHYADTSKEDSRTIHLLRQKKYIMVFVLQKMSKLKQSLFERSTKK